MNYLNTNQAFSLPELLIALALSGLLFVVALRFYLGWVQDFQLANQRSSAVNDQRYALASLSELVAQAGFLGCAKLITLRWHNELASFKKAVAIESAAGGKQSQRLRIQALAPEPLQLLATPERRAARLLVQGAVGWAPGTMMLITDCFNAEFFNLGANNSVLANGATMLSHHKPLSRIYPKGAMVGAYYDLTIYRDGQTLYLDPKWGARQQLLTGVSKFTMAWLKPKVLQLCITTLKESCAAIRVVHAT